MPDTVEISCGYTGTVERRKDRYVAKAKLSNGLACEDGSETTPRNSYPLKDRMKITN
jgi:hypothetical protein